mmetsp:Transcript_31543/g.68231  ORF Transcript_31543/g.68231 Transcript_31543/m.68231 type:complete len:331 (+) Transcript_31543:1271-2263(+)
MSVYFHDCSWMPADSKKINVDAIVGQCLDPNGVVFASIKGHLGKVCVTPITPTECVRTGKSGLSDVVYNKLEGHCVVPIPVGIANGERIRVGFVNADGPFNPPVVSIRPRVLIKVVLTREETLVRRPRAITSVFRGVLNRVDSRWRKIFRRDLEVPILPDVSLKVLEVMTDKAVSTPPRVGIARMIGTGVSRWMSELWIGPLPEVFAVTRHGSNGGVHLILDISGAIGIAPGGCIVKSQVGGSRTKRTSFKKTGNFIRSTQIIGVGGERITIRNRVRQGREVDGAAIAGANRLTARSFENFDGHIASCGLPWIGLIRSGNRNHLNILSTL